MNNFEEKLARLETLSSEIKRPDIALADALKDFEEGIKLAKSMEKELDALEGKIQILMSGGEVEESRPAAARKSEGPELALFSEESEITGTRS